MKVPAIMLVGAVVACGGKSDDPKAAAPRDAPARTKVELPMRTQSMDMKPVPLDEPVIELPKQESFTLLAPGKGTLAPLRYHLATAVGSYLAETALTTRHVDAAGAWTAAIKLATIHDGFSISAQPTNLQLRPLPITLDGATTPDTQQYTASWTAQIADHRANAAIDDRGQLGKVFFNDDPTGGRTQSARDELAQRLLATLVPLPVEPIGVGASWRVVTILRQGHAFVKQTATYTLTAAKPTEWTIDAAIQRVGESQRVTDPAMPPGASVDLVAMFRTVTGTLTLDPTHPLGIGKLTVESRLHARVNTKETSAEELVEDSGTVFLTATK